MRKGAPLSNTSTRALRRRALVAVSALWGMGCGDPPEVSVAVTTGQEQGALGLDPAVALVTVTASNPDGSVKLSASAAPGGSFDLGDVPDTTILGFELEGTTEDGTVVARGRSVSVPIGALGSIELPLFLQRTGSFARAPSDLVRAHVHAPAVIFGERYVLTSGGDSALGSNGSADPALGERYDLLGWTSAGSEAVFSRAARTMVALGDTLLLIDDDGADFVDPNSFSAESAVAPEGFTFAELAGGLAIDGADGVVYVVGATRVGEPSDAVLVIDASGGFTGVRLSQKRAAAAATYVDGVGLVIVGGADVGPAIETVGTDGVTLDSVPYPSDPTTGAAAVVTAEDQIAVIGGRSGGQPAATRILDLRCQADCVPVGIDDAAVPDLAARTRAFNLSSSILLVGEDEDGETLAFRLRLEPGSVEPLPLKQRRLGASISPAPNGTLMVLGGATPGGEPATSVELFFPD